MIYSVRGKLILKEPNFAVIECGGVGYGCRTSYSTVAQLGETGSETMLYTYLYVRADAVELCVPCGIWRQQGVHQDQGYRRKDGAEDSS